MTLRQHIAQVIVDAILRTACWLMRAEELPPLPAGVFDAPIPPEPKWRVLPGRGLELAQSLGLRLRCDHARLGELACVDLFLGQAFGAGPDRSADRRWRQ